MYFFCLVFDFLICNVDVTKKKEKKKKEKYSEKEMCDLYFVYECFFCMIKLQE